MHDQTQLEDSRKVGGRDERVGEKEGGWEGETAG